MACFWILRCVHCFRSPLARGNIDLLNWVLLHKVLNITFLSSNRSCVHLLLDFRLNAPKKIFIHKFASLYWFWPRNLLTFYCYSIIFIAALHNWLLMIRLGRSHELFVVTTIPRRLLLFQIIIKHAGVDSSLFQGIYLWSLLLYLLFWNTKYFRFFKFTNLQFRLTRLLLFFRNHFNFRGLRTIFLSQWSKHVHTSLLFFNQVLIFICNKIWSFIFLTFVLCQIQSVCKSRVINSLNFLVLWFQIT